MRGLAQLRHVVGVPHWPLADDAAVRLDVGHDLPPAAEHAVAQAVGAVHPELAVQRPGDVEPRAFALGVHAVVHAYAD